MGFVKAARSAVGVAPPKLAEIAFAGRSNVGKSSLLNALSGNRSSGRRGTVGIASVANKPGVTKTINFYANPLGAQLVDLPGYGFAYAADEQVEVWQAQMRAYLAQRGTDAPLRVLLLIDSRQSLKQSDRDFALWLDREARVPLHVVMSKCDLVRAKELAKRHTLLSDELRKLQLHNFVRPVHMISSKTMGGIDLLRATLATTMPEKILRRGRKLPTPGARELRMAEKAKEAAEERPLFGPASSHSVSTAEIATPAARQFAEQLAARRATRGPEPEPARRGAEAALDRAFQGMHGGVGRAREQRMARDFSKIRLGRRRDRNRLARRR